jgi:DNA-directed RNA polymerase subunit RPC12/RpoP
LKKTEVILRCSLCGQEHRGEDVKAGWFAEFKTDKMVKAKRLICPACLHRMGVKVNQN